MGKKKIKTKQAKTTATKKTLGREKKKIRRRRLSLASWRAGERSDGAPDECARSSPDVLPFTVCGIEKETTFGVSLI